MSSKAKTKSKYQKMDPIDHILHRPDTYIGSTRLRKLTEYIAQSNESGYHISKKSISSSPALLRIFVEPLSNAVDNVARSLKTKTPCTKIKVSVDLETGKTCVWNDGESIDIEINEEQNCYNHTMIFGQLLTSSNYDDEKERIDVSGRNGLGCKLCLKAGTLIPDWNGNILKVEDIQIGQKLIGDDGTARTVTNKVTGNGKLYEVIQQRGQSYIVNEHHIITIRMPDHKVIFWNTAKNGWSMLWLDKEEKQIHMKSISVAPPKITCPECKTELCGNLRRHWKRMHKDKNYPKIPRKSPTIDPPYTEEVQEAHMKMQEFSFTIPDDNTLDISIKDYKRLSPTTKGRLTGFTGKCVQWDEQKVDLDPYVLGLWLGDGYQSGYGIAINTDDDPEILEYLEKWGEKNDAKFKNVPSNKVDYRISSLSKCGVSPLKKLLNKYNLVNNKHIPKEYLVNSREVRLSVLAGMIDSDGCVTSDGRRITIAQGMDHSKLASDFIYLAKSLGFMCSSHIKKTQWKYKGEMRRGNAVNINISGEGVEDIPTLVKRKKCLPPLKRNTLNTGKLKIKEVESGDFVGLEVDGNNRFVLEDFTVTHNCNVFSNDFTVFTFDPKTKQTFKQTWSNNMKTVSKPVIKPSTKYTKGFTQVTWTPDFKRLGLKGYTTDIINLYCRYVIDAAMLTKVKVYFNSELIPVKSLNDYAKLYLEEPTKEILFIKTKTAEISLTPSTEYETISFASGVYTCNDGTHVDAWSEAIFRPLVKKFNKPKKPQVNIKDVKQFFRLFVVASVKNPAFDSQDKSKLESPPVTASVKSTVITQIMKWSVCDQIQDIIRGKEMLSLKKTERKKKGFTKVEGLDPANNAGTKHSTDCTLILCEGLSAKTYAVQGIEVGVFGKKGRDWFGIMPLRGKLLNIRDKKPSSIADNKVISGIIKAAGFRYGIDYTVEKNYKTLQYGKIMILTDSDTDGIHISGLIQNTVHGLFPSLLKREQSYLTAMYTPIVRVYLSKTKSKLFYDEDEYRKYVEVFSRKYPNKKLDKKYYKGLGTSSESDIMETFGQKMIKFTADNKTTLNMNKVFAKKNADARKEWLTSYNPNHNLLTWDGNKKEVVNMNISDFINNELIKFSISDCKRSIPHVMDGLKESLRKVLYSCFLRNLKYSGKTLKIAQLAGYTAEHSGYHHGEQNLYDTITKMAHEFPGSNNIPLLYRDGQLGTRLNGGKDAANARYTFTKLDKLTRLLFKIEDDPLLERVEDDGDVVEPKRYLPILPMVLVNGITSGIGTGWSCSVPSYNPLDLIKGIKTWLKYDGDIIVEEDGLYRSLLPELHPWYRGFTGRIVKDKDTRYKIYGIISDEGKKRVVTELPIGMWTDNFKESLDTYLEAKQIKSVKNYSTPKKVRFEIVESKDGFVCNEKTLKLHKYISTTNMVLFTEDGTLKKFEDADEILDYFCTVRYEYYGKRKKHILGNLKKSVKFLGNKRRFLEEVMSGDLSLYEGKQSREEEDIVADLEKRKYDKESKTTKNEDGEDIIITSYDYLLRMQIRSFTTKKLNSLKKDIDSILKKIDNITKTSEKQMWINDLDEFEKVYLSWLKEIAKEKVKKPRKKT